MKYGYDSPDSFTKAFTRFHGVTPSAVRKEGAMIKSFVALRIKFSLEGGYVMDYKIVEKDEFNKQQFKNDQAQKNQGKNEQVSARAWHLANIKRILDLLDSFGFEQNNHVTVQTEDATIASRIVQPMDYSQKELGNECYWPVWTENEIERGQGR